MSGTSLVFSFEMECDVMEDLQAASRSVVVKLVLVELIPEGRCAPTVEKSRSDSVHRTSEPTQT